MKKFFIIIFICAFFTQCFFIQKRVYVKECIFNLANIYVDKITFNYIDLQIFVRVINGNNFDVIIDKMELDFFIHDQKISKIIFPGITIEPNFAKIMKFNAHIEFKDLKESFKILIRERGTAIYKFTGIVYLKSVFGIMEYNINWDTSKLNK